MHAHMHYHACEIMEPLCTQDHMLHITMMHEDHMLLRSHAHAPHHAYTITCCTSCMQDAHHHECKITCTCTMHARSHVAQNARWITCTPHACKPHHTAYLLQYCQQTSLHMDLLEPVLPLGVEEPSVGGGARGGQETLHKLLLQLNIRLQHNNKLPNG